MRSVAHAVRRGPEEFRISTTGKSRAAKATGSGKAFDWPGWIVDMSGRPLANGRVVLIIALALLIGTFIGF